MPELPIYPEVNWAAKYPPSEDGSRNPFLDSVEPDVLTHSVLLAWMSLETLTALTFEQTPKTIRPGVVASITEPLYFGSSYLGVSFYAACGCTGMDIQTCSHRLGSELTLPERVGRIVNVEIGREDGIGSYDLPRLAYRLEGSRILVRQDGDPWPSNQDMESPLGCLDTWAVTYTTGAPASETAMYVAGILAAEFLADAIGGKCRLPRGTTSVVRNGISFDVERNLFGSSGTGIPEVDAYVASINPNRLAQPASFLSIRAARSRRQGVI